MDKKEIDAWIKYQYDPQHMFCFWQNDKITSCLQVTKRTMMFLGRQMHVSVLVWLQLYQIIDKENNFLTY